jgi:sugar lactone lactonase YvrE
VIPQVTAAAPASDDRTTRPAARDAAPCQASAPARPGYQAGEHYFFAILLIVAALVRLVSLGQLEPNVATVEVTHLATIEELLAGSELGADGRAGVGASGPALLPAALLRFLWPEPELALRIYATLGSLAFIALFYALCRSRFTPVVSLTATGMLAFSPWSIYFGRNGELNAFVAAWAIVATLALDRALRGGGPRLWMLAGAAASIGLYWHPSAIWIVPALVIPIAWSAIADPPARPWLARALCILLVAGLIIAAPRIPALVAGPISTSALLAEEGAPPAPPTTARQRVQQTVRSFFLLDPTVTGDPRYLTPGQAPLDSVTGLLVLAGLALSAWRLSASVLPLALYLVPLVGSQLASPIVPTLGDAVVVLPGLYLIVAAALDRLVVGLPFPSVTRAALLVAIPAYAVFAWQTYSGWIGSPASAQARQPALDYDEIDAWIGEQRARLEAGLPAVTAHDWREEHPRLMTGSRVVRRPRDASPELGQRNLAELELRPVSTVAGEPGQRAPRGVAANGNSDVHASDTSGRVSRIDLQRGELVALPERLPPLEQVSDLAADADGFLYLADAERSVLVKLGPSGKLVAVLGGDWGMYRPRGLTVGPDGRLYVADTGRNRIAVGTAEGRFLKSITPPASFGTFEQPTDVAVDASGRIYVGLPEIGRLVILDESGRLLGGWPIPRSNTIESARLAVVADGAVAMTAPEQAQVRLLDADGRELAVAPAPGRPYGVAVADGRLFVTDPASGRVLVYSLGGP